MGRSATAGNPQKPSRPNRRKAVRSLFLSPHPGHPGAALLKTHDGIAHSAGSGHTPAPQSPGIHGAEFSSPFTTKSERENGSTPSHIAPRLASIHGSPLSNVNDVVPQSPGLRGSPRYPGCVRKVCNNHNVVVPGERMCGSPRTGRVGMLKTHDGIVHSAGSGHTPAPQSPGIPGAEFSSPFTTKSERENGSTPSHIAPRLASIHGSPSPTSTTLCPKARGCAVLRATPGVCGRFATTTTWLCRGNECVVRPAQGGLRY